ncbi:hypothetical protein [Tepidibacter hydrothermalis]|uniref:DUF2304 domain-containing protein n=1 Tax=Tepidibacter hydrothermalis TaxID=3036126 RepID=A0ABY8E941_9FIRM|nr:hypothetical protein [Tepidibacter hydrothermalis]WFD09425.1 hypothetical protein P4S50_13645 [Tepidibacter hydrothermalis]
MLICSKIILALLSIFCLSLGILILRKKPIVIKGYIFTLFITLCYLPMLINPFIYDFLSPYSLVNCAFIIFLIFIFKKSFGSITIYNINEDLLYESLSEALEKENVEYEEKRGEILLPSLDSKIKISFHPVASTANVHINLKKDKFLYNQIIKNLKQVLSDKKVDHFLLSAITNIACSVFLIIALITILD